MSPLQPHLTRSAALAPLVAVLLLPLAAGAATVPPPASSPTNAPPALATNTAALPVRPPPKPALVRPITPHNPIPPEFQSRLDEAVKLKREMNPNGAEKVLVALMELNAPVEVHRIALLELATLAEEARQFTKAQQILAQFLKQFPDDNSRPEVLLRQGLAYRQMGANVLALSKFYAVMSTVLNLKSNDLNRYHRLVLEAQTEIAETYFLQGKFTEAADFFTRLLRLENPDLNKQHVRFKHIHVLSHLGRHTEAAAQARTFIESHPQAAELAEVRFLLADSLKRLGRNREAMQEVLTLLAAQQVAAEQQPENWVYWQQRTGNDIANQLYKEGDFLNALQIYRTLADLSDAPAWQLPAWYQVGLVYERLQQPQLAADAYGKIAARAKSFGTNSPAPSLAAVVDMAQWRKTHIQWQTHAEQASAQLNLTPPAAVSLTNNTPDPTHPPPAKAP